MLGVGSGIGIWTKGSLGRKSTATDSCFALPSSCWPDWLHCISSHPFNPFDTLTPSHILCVPGSSLYFILFGPQLLCRRPCQQITDALTVWWRYAEKLPTTVLLFCAFSASLFGISHCFFRLVYSLLFCSFGLDFLIP